MASLYVVGGQQRRARSLTESEEHWYKYRQGLVLHVDTQTGDVRRCVEYESPAEACADEEPAILFKSATLDGGRLYACTQTEVLVYSIPDFQQLHYVSLPCFNDVHHVRPTPDGGLLIANSGLDMVLETTLEGEILRIWNTIDEEPWGRFSKTLDYRRVASTKPHRSHPNHVFYVQGEVWVTRFEQRDAISLTGPKMRIDIGIERVHDGVTHEGFIYFTTVNAHVVIVDARTFAIADVIDLNAVSSDDDMLGWCRGVFVSEGRIWVGFSRLRLTAFRQNLSWVRWGFKRQLPSRLACYDLDRRTLLNEFDVQAHGLDAVFSIHPADQAS